MPKFYITGGRTEQPDGSIGWRDDTQPPLIGEGANRLSALAASGITVWTEEEYKAMIARHPPTTIVHP